MLKKPLQSIERGTESSVLTFDDGDSVTAKVVAGSPKQMLERDIGAERVTVTKSVSIISSSLKELFPLTSEGGVQPAAAVVVVPSSGADEPPVLIFVHTADAGECPQSQGKLTIFVSHTRPACT